MWWFEDAFYDRAIGRVVAVGTALAVSFVFWSLMVLPESPVPPVIGADIAARTGHAFTLWSAVSALLVRPPLPFFAFASGCVYASLLVVVALAAEATINYVANGWVRGAFPVAWALGAASLPVFVVLGWAVHRNGAAEIQDLERPERRQTLVHRLSLNPWVVLFGTVCSVLGIVFTVVSPRELGCVP